ncbi:LruC domain-containing protein [Colwellia psychrerythraea]|uniref:FG-GAP repeat protein n=1 Tax=Colwellia psychrerythraea TaxID=28229 RepID=A0A099KYX3_COLPS|nr:LruC domain-containing protein [Colwellia psychrerythraea]KGJ94848.1 FG-GAP repeat protein [Colwellia psychrerythraea]
MKMAIISILIFLSIHAANADPLLQAITLDLTPAEYRKLGSSVAISGDIAVIGAPGSAGDLGQACLYQRSSENWSLLTCLSPNTEIGSVQLFGNAVSISGELLVISAEKKQNGKHGVAYVYQRQGDTWLQQAELISVNSSSNDKFASTISISENYIAIGSPGFSANNSGAVHIFKSTTSGWVEDIVITPISSFKSANFGASLMLAGEYLIIGDDDHGRAHEGTGYIYRREDDLWSLQASLKGGDITKSANFATSVAISKDYAIIGAKSENNPLIKKHKKSGAVYVYKRTGKLWSSQAKLLASDAQQGDNFGSSVAISADHLLIGAESNNSSRGSTYLFQNINDVWTEVFKFEADDAIQQDNFGHAIAIAQDYIVIGAHNKSVANGTEGVSYLYYLNRDTSSSGREQALTEIQTQLAYDSTEIDSDKDDLNDWDEINILGTDPNLSDSDGDGLTDKEEVMIYQSNPLVVDSDNDGLSDLDEVVLYNSDPILVDTDGDGSSDFEEVMVTKTEPSLVDSDNDGLTDQQELLETNTDPTLADSDGDGLTDNEELNLFNTDPHNADSDNDGFSDGNEVNIYETLPLDSSDTPVIETTSTSYSPADSQFGTMAFEDEWPIKGDYDFNDAVFDYNVEENKVNGLVSRIVFKILPTARGAIYDNSLRLMINTPTSNIGQVTMKLKGVTTELTPVADGNQSLFIIIDKIEDALPPPSGYKMSNTFSGSPKINGNLYTLTINFNYPISSQTLGTAPYNSFISRVLDTGEHIEVHFPGYFPSKKASRRKFGRGQDDSDKSQDRYYQTEGNLPWAMLVPSKWHHTKERVDLSNGYPDILQWASSKGKSKKGWYKSKRNSKFVFENVPDI